jgi:hypothetical protein
MNAEGEHAIVARGSLGHMEEVRGILQAGGVDSELMQPPEGCGSS